MHVISRKKLREFEQKHSEAKESLDAWYKVVSRVRWGSFADVRRTYNHADMVGKFVVFDVGGNNFRIITVVDFEWHKVFIRYVLTHGEYDRGKWKNDAFELPPKKGK